MTFDETVSEICDRLNYSSTDAITRVGKRVNSRYKRATSSIGMVTTRFVENITATATVGSRILTFGGVEKILAIIDKSTGVDVPLTQISIDEMHITPVKAEPPRKFCVLTSRARSVDIKVDGEATTAYILYADGQLSLSTMVGTDEPKFPESFHDILVFGGLADEYRKLEKFPLAEEMEKDYEQRLSDLRMWMAKSAYLDTYQGRYNGKSFRWVQTSSLDN